MSRLIDADALMEQFAKLQMVILLDSVEEAEIASMIGNAPTIDPSEYGGCWGCQCGPVVRCKDCKKFTYTNYIERPYGWCEAHEGTARDDGFCYRGEKNDSD